MDSVNVPVSVRDTVLGTHSPYLLRNNALRRRPYVASGPFVHVRSSKSALAGI